MVATTLVDRLVDDGRGLLTALDRAGFDVSAAAWLSDSDEDTRRLYLVSRSLVDRSQRDLLNAVFDGVTRDGEPDMELYNAVRLTRPDEPVGRSLLDACGRFANRPRSMTHYRSPEFDRLGFTDVLLYPPVARMTSPEVVRAVADLLATADFRPTNGITPAATIERVGGGRLHAIPIGLRRAGDRLLVDLALASDGSSNMPVDEITDIRLE